MTHRTTLRSFQYRLFAAELASVRVMLAPSTEVAFVARNKAVKFVHE